MKRLSEVFDATLRAVEKGKEEIFNIYETTKAESQRLEKELAFLNIELSDTIKKVDLQYKKEKHMRQKLLEVNKNFQIYNEQQMMDAYAEAKDSQLELKLLQSKELQLRARRDEIERSLKNLEETVKQAENLINQISLAISLLRDGITEISQCFSDDQNKEIALRIMKAQEEERRRVAREVHDGPAQSLANIVLRLEIVEKLLKFDYDKVIEELQDLKCLVRNNLKDIRRIIFDLRPINLDHQGIVDAIRNYIVNYQRTYGISCQILIEGQDKRLTPSVKLALFRLVQEGLTNVAKHAESPKVDLNLVFLEEKVVGKIIDYGKGFDPKEVLENPGEHFGLVGIRERVEMFSGKFSLNSVKGKGTVFEFELPYSK
ncbi:MAG: histidine kinase [Peptococcaceae bacterium]|nr:histidine kinase [Peptococcaceae bacterium]